MSTSTARYGPTGIVAFIIDSRAICFMYFCECRGNTWPHVTSDGTAFINVTGASITLEFDVRVNTKGKFEFFLLHNQVSPFMCTVSPIDSNLKPFVFQVNLGQLGLKLVSGYGSTASWFFGIFVAVMRTNVQVYS
jgi:hypothetical protein